MKKRNWNICNVLSAASGSRVLWKFSPDSRRAKLSDERRLQGSDKLPADWVNKGLQTLLGQSKINVAWLRADQVFLRVIKIPSADLTELQSMIELQLEKLSPLAVGQLAWTFEPWGEPIEGLQSVIVIIVERQQIDSLLTTLQGSGFLTDKLEIPLLRQLAATPFHSDGTWVYLGIDGNPARCLTVWHYQGCLQTVHLIYLGDGDARPQRLFEQLGQTIWAGEVEGWIDHPPQWHLVGSDSSIAFWQPQFAAWAGVPPEIQPALTDEELAALTARHAGEMPAEMTIVPPEFTARYRQDLIDRTWMGALFAMAVVYMVAVGCYLGFLEYHRYDLASEDKKVVALQDNEHEYQRFMAKEASFQRQASLQKASIRALRAAAEKLPADLTLTKLNLQNGKVLTLFGTAPADQQRAVTEYADAMAGATDETATTKLFASVQPPNSQTRPGPGGQMTVTWNFACEIKTGGDKEERR